MTADVIKFPRRGDPPCVPGAAGGGGLGLNSSPQAGTATTQHVQMLPPLPPLAAADRPARPVPKHLAGQADPAEAGPDLALLWRGGVHHGRHHAARVPGVSCGHVGRFSAAVRA